ncbi:NIPSNAP family protein [Runella sp. SP2]|uniref:NIPSNAP family protein n=1 Tax=Runella sp. SP2 TaxID=2268026 RepID=UPI000F095E4F|nr:NIPSNAP family protein [Runella sp. SP2]AYQ33688.1 NIPSNAP family protein [Runella sp. SP2]
MFKQFLTIMLLFAAVLTASAQDTRLFETRIYYTEPGRLEALLARFRNHTTKIFEKHGMTNIGYWVPLHEENKLIYVLAYPDRAARDAAWKAFGADPEWVKVRTESEVSGKIVSKVESIFMDATDFSPKIKSSKSKKDRVFELRTYTTNPGKLPDLLARFRNHTLKLFKKHGMTNVAYWTVNGKDDTLIYILAHPSEEAGKKAFDAFRADPDWVKARDASEVNGKLANKVESVYMKATDFSTIK